MSLLGWKELLAAIDLDTVRRQSTDNIPGADAHSFRDADGGGPREVQVPPPTTPDVERERAQVRPTGRGGHREDRGIEGHP
ncbi:hypothetical protein PHK61_29110 [Actinomycetospora lutea]|uniref:hypothetical protein n=1 Tax=Actinomycetospora lutea TaxID=663604 RepID=UPI00236627E2|nr:hypothetical protein [Actinomycetospora lutea]MDD7942481.1 hypothetical protein [Actinomycetospora lutea]